MATAESELVYQPEEKTVNPFIAEFTNRIIVSPVCEYNGKNIYPQVEVSFLEEFLKNNCEPIVSLDDLNQKIAGVGIAVKKLIVAASTTREGAMPLGIKIKKNAHPKPQTLDGVKELIMNPLLNTEYYLSLMSSDNKGLTMSLFTPHPKGHFFTGLFIQLPVSRTIDRDSTKAALTYFALDNTRVIENPEGTFSKEGTYSPSSFPSDRIVNSGYAKVLSKLTKEFIDCF